MFVCGMSYVDLRLRLRPVSQAPPAAPFPGSQQHRHPTMSSAIVCASFGNKLQQATTSTYNNKNNSSNNSQNSNNNNNNNKSNKELPLAQKGKTRKPTNDKIFGQV